MISQLLRHIYPLLLIIILLGAFALRLYRFDNPIADWHSWRQADTSSVSRIFVKDGFDLLHPRYHDLSNVPSGEDNPHGYRFVEFPIYNVLQGGGFVLFDYFSLEEWGRLVTIAVSLLSTIFLFLIVSRHSSRFVGILSAFFFAFLPFNIYYGRVILPDPSMVAATLGAIYFFDVWTTYAKDKGQRAKVFSWLFLALSILFAASALLLKPFAVFFLLPIVILAYNAFGLGVVKNWKIYLFAALSVAPFFLWRSWMQQYPEGIPVSDWLFNGGDIRFKGAYFYWIFADRIGRLILGYFGIGLLILGILFASSKHSLAKKKDMFFFFSFLLGSLLYVTIIARGNVQHDYYQIPLIPSLAIFLAFGSAFLLKPTEGFSRVVTSLILITSVVFMLMFGWYHVRDYYNINNPNIVVAGEAVDRLTPPDAKVLTFYGGDTSFLYQTKRSGWASLQASLPEMVALGATHLAIVNPTKEDIEGLGSEYEVLARDPKYLILKLQ